FGRGFGDGFRRFDVQRLEILLAALVHGRDEVDDGVGVFERGVDRLREAHIRLHQLHLADITHHAQFGAKVRTAHRNAHAVTALGQRAHDLLPDEAGAAEHNDEIASTHCEAHHQPAFRARAQYSRTEARNFVEMCRYGWFGTDWQQPGNQDGATAWLMFLRNDAEAPGLNKRAAR